MSDYPECEKMSAVKEDSSTLSGFLDWLDETGRSICTMQDMRGIVDTGAFPQEQYYPDRITKEQLLAEYFKIDLDKVEEERRAILDDIRSKQG